MSYEITFRVEAENDLNEINLYYGRISTTLAQRFFAEFFETLKYIEQNPNLFQKRYLSIKIAPMYKFPYGVHYRERAGQIVIFRILHTKRYFRH